MELPASLADEELEVYTQKAAPPIAAAAIPPMSRVLLLLGAGVLGGTSVEYLRNAGLRKAAREPRAEEDGRERGAVREEVGGVKGVEADVRVCELEVCLGIARDEDGEVGAREVDEPRGHRRRWCRHGDGQAVMHETVE